MYAIQDWPLEVLISDEEPVPNTGAIRLSDAADRDAAQLVAGLARPWDCGLESYHSDRILAHLETFLSRDLWRRVEDAFAENAELEVI